MSKYLFILLLLVSCGSVPPKEGKPKNFSPLREAFLGYWIGESVLSDGKFMRWLVERRIDGTFTLTHVIRANRDDKTPFDPEKAKFELGTWGVSGDIFFTATRQYFENKKIGNFDVTDAGLYDAYKIVSFDGETFTYRSLESGEEFTVKKFPKDQKIEL